MAGFRITDCTSMRAPGRLVRRIDKLMRGLLEERLAPFGLSYAQWAVLKMLREGVLSTLGDVARELDYTTGATTRLIDALERSGLVVRVRDLDDRRSIRLAETESGRAVMDAAKPVVIGLWNEMVADFDQAEADRFVDALVKLVAAIEARAGERTEVTA